MKKILIFSLAYYPHIGGAEVAIKKITNHIHDIEWHMITLRFGGEPKEEKNENIYVHRVGQGSSYFSKIIFIIDAVREAKKLHSKYNFDGIWAMMSYMLFPVVILRMLGIYLPYALTLQEGDMYEHMFGRLRILPFLPILSIGFRNAGVVQTISNYLSGWARRRGYSGKIEVIPNGCDVFWFAKKDHLTQNRQVFWKRRHDMDIDDTKFILITASRLVKKNAISDVIQSLPALSKNVNFVILGKGEEKEKLLNLAIKLKVLDRVYFVGEVSNSDVANHLPMSDIFVRPSLSEGMGNSFIEAMAAGLPVIATPVGGITDFLKDGETGLFCNVRDPKSIAEKVELLLNDKELREKIISNATKMVREKYDWNLIAKTMKEKVFDRLFTVHL